MTTGDTDRELEELRAEVGQLRTQVADAQADAQAAHQEAQAAKATTAQLKAAPPQPRRHTGWRTPVASVLIVLGCLLAPVSVLAVWTSNQLANTDSYVANVTPLIHEPAVQSVLTDRISAAITRQVNVKGYVNLAGAELSKRGLPRVGGLISGFSGTIAGGVDGFIHSTVGKVIRTPAVARLWVRANQIAHAQLVKTLSGQKNSAIVMSGDQVVLTLGPLISQVKHALAARGLTVVNKLPAINPTFRLFNAKYLIQLRSLYSALNRLKWILPILALVLIAAGIYIFPRHRRALISASLGLIGAMLLLAIGLAVGRVIYLNEVPASVLPPDAAAAVFDILVRFIKQALRTIMAIGLVVALGAFFTGPSTAAVRTRDAFKSAFAKIRGSDGQGWLNTGPVGPWVYRYRTILRIAAAVIAALVIAFTPDPTGLAVLIAVIVLLAVLGLIELIATPPRPAESEPSGPAQGRPASVVPGRSAGDGEPTADTLGGTPASPASRR